MRRRVRRCRSAVLLDHGLHERRVRRGPPEKGVVNRLPASRKRLVEVVGTKVDVVRRVLENYGHRNSSGKSAKSIGWRLLAGKLDG